MSILDSIGNAASGLINDIEQDVGQGVGDVLNVAKSAATEAVGDVESAVSSAGNLINSVPGEISGLVNQGESALMTAVKDAVNSASDIFSGMLSDHSAHPAGGTPGYAPAPGTGQAAAPGDTYVPPSMDEATAMYILQQNFDAFDTASGGAKDGLVGRNDLQAVLNDPKTSAEMKAAAQYLLQSPVNFNQADTAQNGGACDGLIGRGDVATLLDKAVFSKGPFGVSGELSGIAANAAKAGADWSSHAAAAAQHSASPAPANVHTASAPAGQHKAIAPNPTQTSSSSGASAAPSASPTPASPDLTSALQTIEQNFELLDTAAGIGGQDGIIGRNDLQAILNNPDAPADLKSAAKLLLDNPAFFNELDVASGVGSEDGLFSKGDLSALLGKLTAGDPAPSSSGSSTPPPTASAGTAGGSSTAVSAPQASSTSSSTGTSSSSPSGGTSSAGASSGSSTSVSSSSAGGGDGLTGVATSAQDDLNAAIQQMQNHTGTWNEGDLEALQTRIQQDQELMTMVSNIEKELHDMRMAIINNIH